MTARLIIRADDDPRQLAARIVAAKARGLTDEEAAAVEAWRAQSPEHALELALAEDLYVGAELAHTLREVRAQERASTRARIEALLGDLRVRIALAGMATAAAAVALVLNLAPPSGLSPGPRPPVSVAFSYETLRGETSERELNDGTLVALSADTALSWRPSDTQRTVVLTRGEAFFDVAHDADRPFRVDTHGAVFEALGTQFNVDRRSAGVELTVYEGVVRVSRADWSAELRPGDVMLIAQDGATTRSRIDPVDGPDWRDGWFEARSTPLDDVAEELQRYAGKRIIVAENASDRVIVGRFRLTEPDDALSRIASMHGLTFSETDSVLLLTGAAR